MVNTWIFELGENHDGGVLTINGDPERSCSRPTFKRSTKKVASLVVRPSAMTAAISQRRCFVERLIENDNVDIIHWRQRHPAPLTAFACPASQCGLRNSSRMRTLRNSPP